MTSPENAMTTLLEKIRSHPFVTESEFGGALSSGARTLHFCPKCVSLCAWDGMGRGLHDWCGVPLVPIERVSGDDLSAVLRNLDRDHGKEKEYQAFLARYPFPPETKDHRYRCVVCKKRYTLTLNREIHSPRRLACSYSCEIAFLGKEKPPGRKWAGFVTLYPVFKGTKVLYLGTLRRGRKKLECYWWSEGVAGGSFYAYYGDGDYDSHSIQMGFGRQHMNEWKDVFELYEKGDGVDESWRVGANVKDGYEW